MAVWPFYSKAKDAESYERELSNIETKVAKHQQAQLTWSLRVRRVKGLVTLYSVLLYVAFNVYMVFGKVKWSLESASVLVLVPIAIWAIRYIIQAAFKWIDQSNEERLKALLIQKESIAEEIKQKMNFYQAKAILDRFGMPLKDSEEKSPTPKKKRNSGRIDDPKARGSPSKPGVSDGTPSKSDASISRPGSSTSRPGTPNAMLIDPSTPRAQMGSPLRPNSPGSPFTPGSWPSQPILYERHWYDRILDLLVGEDERSPNSRYALICSTCHHHNGLCQYGEQPQDVYYLCPFCRAPNGRPEKQKTKQESKNDIKSDVKVNKDNITDEKVPAENSTTEEAEVKDQLKDDDSDVDPDAQETTTTATQQRKLRRRREK